MNKENEFVNILIKRLYKNDATKICEINGLKYKIYDESDGYFVFYDMGNENKSQYSLVVGGACIDRCDGKIDNLGINFYYDILMPINYALKYNLDCAIYVDTPIEVYGKIDSERQKWINFSSEVEQFIKELSKILDINIYIIRRDIGIPIIDKILKNIDYEDGELKGLYDLIPSSKFAFFSDDLLLHFRRPIVSYLPQYLSEYLGKDIENVIVVEELSQSKAIGKAKEIDSNIYAKLYLDMPSTSCRNRMHRSENNKIKIFEEINLEAYNPLFLKFIEKIDLDEVYKIMHVDNYKSLLKRLNNVWED